MPFSEQEYLHMAATVREGLGTGDDNVTMERHAQIMVGTLTAHRSKKTKNRFVLIAAAACLTVLAAVAWIGFHKNEPMAFYVNTAQNAGQSGDWISASVGRSALIRFEQGSKIRIEKGSAVRVIENSGEAVMIELAQGSVYANIVGNGKTKWQISVGPYQVRVLGTIFSVDWNPKQNEIFVQVSKGLVLVQGGHLSAHGIHVSKGNAVVVNGNKETVALSTLGRQFKTRHSDEVVSTPDNGSAEIAEQLSLELPALEKETLTGHQKFGMDANNKKPTHGRVRWKKYYRENDFVQAMEAAQKHGVSHISATSPLSDLWSLAEVARHVGKFSIQNQVLISIRKRFPRSSKAKVAAFLIGQSQITQAPKNVTAAKWFEKYLNESASGAMGQEAYNRLMQLYKRTGYQAKAKHTAERYLKEYPNGLYAYRAQRLLAR